MDAIKLFPFFVFFVLFDVITSRSIKFQENWNWSSKEMSDEMTINFCADMIVVCTENAFPSADNQT